MAIKTRQPELNRRQEELGTGFLPWAYIHATFPTFHQAWTWISPPTLNNNVTSSKPVHALVSLHFWHHPLHYWQHLPPLSTPLTPSSHTLCTSDTTFPTLSALLTPPFPQTFTKSLYIMDQGRTQHSSKVANEPPEKNQPAFFVFSICFLPPRLLFLQMNRKRMSLTGVLLQHSNWKVEVAGDCNGGGRVGLGPGRVIDIAIAIAKGCERDAQGK